MKKLLFMLLLVMLCVAYSCNNQSRTPNEQTDSIATPDTLKNVYDRVCALMKEHGDNDDSIAVLLLNSLASGDSIVDIPGITVDRSADGRLFLVAISNGGTMCSGTTYVLYKKDTGDGVVKKVAYAKECEEGGVEFPMLYRNIRETDKGYVLIGRFSFSSNDEVYEGELPLSQEYLEGDKDNL